MFRIESDNSIRLTRGDTAWLEVTLANDADESGYEMQPGDTLTLTVKKTTADVEPSFQKVLTGGNQFHIEPADTAGLAFGRYKYDIQLTTTEGDVYTIIEPTNFEIAQEVTC